MIVKSGEKDLPRTKLLISLVVLVIVGFYIRLHGLGDDSFWIDEIFTILSARSDLSELAGVRDHPPLIYALTSASIQVFDESEFSARIPSLIAGTLAIPAIVLLGRSLGVTKAGLWAALLLCFSPFHLRYSQEARHYGLLLLLSLLSYSFLILNLRRTKWSTWLAFVTVTALNLYTHYAAMLVLFTQGVVVTLWSFKLFIQQRSRKLIYPFLAMACALILFLPWVPNLIEAFNHNIGPDSQTPTGGIVPLQRWLEVAYRDFGMNSEVLAAVLLALCILGLIYMWVDKRWLLCLLTLSGLTLPLVLILFFQVSRGAFSRFIIYILPIYLLTAAFAIDRTISLTKRSNWQGSYRVVSIATIIGFIILARPRVVYEHQRISADWRNIATYLKENAESDFVTLGLSLSYRSDLNTSQPTLSFYYAMLGMSAPILEGNRLGVGHLEPFYDQERPVWAVASVWTGAPQSKDGSIEAVPFQTNLYVLNDINQTGSTIERLIGFYMDIMHVAASPEPRCYMQRDLATLYLAAGKYELAETELTEGKRLCPDLSLWPAVAIYEGLLGESPPARLSDDGIKLAEKLLTHDSKNIAALDYLSTYSLMDLYEQDDVLISNENSPLPLDKKRFTMPSNGDWGEVILAHPPTSISFNLTLPPQRTAFSSRIALDPDSWEWGGDGATFVIRIQDETGQTTELFRQHIGNQKVDQKWHDVLVPLENYKDQNIILTLATESGPAGDGTGDWAGWESPRIIWLSP